jgi:hypothetical protein
MGFRSKGRYYWNDPDEGETSGFVIFQKMEGDNAVVCHEEHVGTIEVPMFEVLPGELMTEKKANLPRYVIGSNITSRTGEPLFWSVAKGWVILAEADLLSQVQYDEIAHGSGLPAGGIFVLLPPSIIEKL